MTIAEKVRATQHSAERIIQFLDAVQARGYTPHDRTTTNISDVRDAAHEACHALQWKVTKPWTRENIHAKCPKRIGDKLVQEILARAVEQLVCADLGAPCDSIEKCAHHCFMEMLQNEKIRLPSGEWLAELIRERMREAPAKELAVRVLALVQVRP